MPEEYNADDFFNTNPKERTNFNVDLNLSEAFEESITINDSELDEDLAKLFFGFTTDWKNSNYLSFYVNIYIQLIKELNNINNIEFINETNLGSIASMNQMTSSITSKMTKYFSFLWFLNKYNFDPTLLLCPPTNSEELTKHMSLDSYAFLNINTFEKEYDQNTFTFTYDKFSYKIKLNYISLKDTKIPQPQNELPLELNKSMGLLLQIIRKTLATLVDKEYFKALNIKELLGFESYQLLWFFETKGIATVETFILLSKLYKNYGINPITFNQVFHSFSKFPNEIVLYIDSPQLYKTLHFKNNFHTINIKNKKYTIEIQFLPFLKLV